MPDLKDIRRMLRGEEVEGIAPEPSRVARPRPKDSDPRLSPSSVDLEKMTVRSARYTVSTDGRDAVLNFGKHKGKTLSLLALSSDASYLDWILGQEFPEELKGIVRSVQGRMKLRDKIKEKTEKTRARAESALEKKPWPMTLERGEKIADGYSPKKTSLITPGFFGDPEDEELDLDDVFGDDDIPY